MQNTQLNLCTISYTFLFRFSPNLLDFADSVFVECCVYVFFFFFLLHYFFSFFFFWVVNAGYFTSFIAIRGLNSHLCNFDNAKLNRTRDTNAHTHTFWKA